MLVTFLGILLIFGTLFSTAAAENVSENTECYAIGTATIYKGDRVRAKNNAIHDALVKGAENYLVRLLGNQAVATHFESLVSGILPNIDQQIGNFHILAEQTTGNQYHVFVKIRLNENSLAESLRKAGVYKAAGQSIKVLFMVTEIRGPVKVFWWENPDAHPALAPIELALHSVFQDRGFSPVNRIMDLPVSSLPEAPASSNLGAAAAAEWGRLFSADAVVYGSSRVLDNNLILDLKAVDTKTGIQICEKSQTQLVPSGAVDNQEMLEIMKKCVTRLAVDLCPCIIKNIDTAPQSARKLDVTLAGISQPRQFQTFSDFLRTRVSGVSSVIPSRISDDSMSATVYFKGDRVTFISQVLNNQSLPFPLHLGQTDTENILFVLE